MDINKLALYFSAVLALAVAILSLVGPLENVAWFRDRIDVISLLLISALILFLATNVDRRLAELEAQGKRPVETALRESLGNLPPTLRKLFAPYLERWAKNLKQATAERRLRLEPVDQFPHFYCETLASFPREHFWATSLASREFFWKNTPVVGAIKAFIDGGGSMTRIFFLDSAVGGEDSEVRKIIQEQQDAGVEVYTVDSTKISGDWQKTFVVAETADFAWTVVINASLGIGSVEATADAGQVAEYRDLYKRLLKDPSVKKW